MPQELDATLCEVASIAYGDNKQTMQKAFVFVFSEKYDQTKTLIVMVDNEDAEFLAKTIIEYLPRNQPRTPFSNN